MVEMMDGVPVYEHGLIRRLYDYWRDLCVDGQAPYRSSVDPLEVLPVLPFIWIYERKDDGRFLCRLAGENVRAVLDRKVINEYLEDFVGDEGISLLKGRYGKVLSMPAIGHVVGSVYPAATGRYGQGERLILPLRDDEGRYRFVMGATIYRNADLQDTSDGCTTKPKQSTVGAIGKEPVRTLTPLSAALGRTDA